MNVVRYYHVEAGVLNPALRFTFISLGTKRHDNWQA